MEQADRYLRYIVTLTFEMTLPLSSFLLLDLPLFIILSSSYNRQLEQLAPTHPLIQRTQDMSEAFDITAAKYLPTATNS